MQIAIIDCGAGNLHSVRKAFAFATREWRHAHITVTTTPEGLSDASHIVLPGVGAFAECMGGLLAHPGLREALEEKVLQQGTPCFGICVGMQMMLTYGHEFGTTEGLGWFAGDVVRLSPADTRLRIPHMGWNNLQFTQPTHPLFHGLDDGAHAYFVHSYHARLADRTCLLATCDYGAEVVAAIGRDNIVASQFHPEKSQAVGLSIISNFLRM